MGSSKAGNTSQQRLIETITLLWTLNEIPERPSKNDFPTDFDRDRRLTIERETEIVDSLAFLSAATDDPNRVMAVCVEEDAAHNRLVIRMASNIGILDQVDQDFKQIAKALEKASLRVNDKMNDSQTLLRHIATLDYARILSRLRSRHAKSTWKTSGKPALLVSLNEAVHDTSINPNEAITIDKLEELREKSAELYTIFLDFEAKPKNSSRSLDVVMDMLGRAHELVSTDDLARALATSRTLDPGVKRFLPEAVGKLGRYFSVSRSLVSAARSRRCRIFEHVSIEACKPTPSPSLVLAPQSVPTLTEALQKVIRPELSADQHALERMVEQASKKPFPVAQGNFLHRLTLNDNPTWKVHAEIQLLLFYERHPEKQRPRVICSSKSACYLCDLFVKLHGQFHMPRTHGRLYDRWIIPAWATGHQGLKTVMERLNGALRDKINSTLVEPRIFCSHPNESVLVPPAHWSSSGLASSVATVVTATGSANYSIADPISPASRSIPESSPSISMQRALSAEFDGPCSSSSSNSGLSNHSYQSVIKPDGTFEKMKAQSASSKALHVETPSDATISPHPFEWARQGRNVWRKLSDTSCAFSVSADKMNLTICAESPPRFGFPEAGRLQRECWIRVHWLTADEWSRMDDRGRNVVQIDDLTDGSEITTECGAAIGSESLYVCAGRDVVSVKYEIDGPPPVADGVEVHISDFQSAA